MLGLLTAAIVGIFSSMFNISAPASMARYDKGEAPAYRQEYSSSYFDDGFQRNDESGTIRTAGNDLQSLPDERKVSGVYIPPKTDISSARSSENAKDGHDSVTVLSGD